MEQQIEAAVIAEAMKYTPDQNVAELLAEKTMADVFRTISPETSPESLLVICKAQLCLTYAAYRRTGAIPVSSWKIPTPAGSVKSSQSTPNRVDTIDEVPARQAPINEVPARETPAPDSAPGVRNTPKRPAGKAAKLQDIEENTKFDPEKTTLWMPSESQNSISVHQVARASSPGRHRGGDEEPEEEYRSVRHSMLNSLLVVGAFAAFLFMLWEGGLFTIFFR